MSKFKKTIRKMEKVIFHHQCSLPFPHCWDCGETETVKCLYKSTKPLFNKLKRGGTSEEEKNRILFEIKTAIYNEVCGKGKPDCEICIGCLHNDLQELFKEVK